MFVSALEILARFFFFPFFISQRLCQYFEKDMTPDYTAR